MRFTGGMPSTEKLEVRRAAQDALYERYVAYKNGPQWARFQELEALERSGEPQRVEAEYRRMVYAGSPEEAKMDEFERLRKSAAVSKVLKGGGDVNHPEYQRFRALEKELNSPEFSERVAFLKDKDKYQHSEVAKAMNELRALRTSSELKWFLATGKRADIRRRESEEVILFDDFDGRQMDAKLWSPRFFWADALVGQSFSMSTDPQCYTDGKNVALRNSCLVIETRRERAEGVVWDRALGFMPKRFSYTSGLLNTAQGFHFEEGLLEAKIRFKGDPGVVHALYMRTGQQCPQIDVFRSSPKGDTLEGRYTVAPDVVRSSEVGRLPYSDKFFILSLRKEPGRMVWAINGVTFHEERRDLPNSPLHFVFASTILPGYEPAGVSMLEIDWVRCTVPRHA